MGANFARIPNNIGGSRKVFSAIHRSAGRAWRLPDDDWIITYWITRFFHNESCGICENSRAWECTAASVTHRPLQVATVVLKIYTWMSTRFWREKLAKQYAFILRLWIRLYCQLGFLFPKYDTCNGSLIHYVAIHTSVMKIIKLNSQDKHVWYTS